VVPESRQDAAKSADAEIKDRVDKALADDKALTDSDIDVESVNQGVVLLEGSATSVSDHLRALELARKVPGVRQVKTQVTSPNEIADEEIRKERREAAGDVPSEPVSDAWITSAVKMRLLANSETPALDINVDTMNGAVTLFGIVPTAAAKAAAEAEARKANGVKSVQNELQVVAARAQEAVEAKDDEITRRVNAAMQEREAFRDANIDVEVKNGVVRLTGAVPNESVRLAAAVAARGVAGVKAVQDDLQVKPKS
jgi:hyperosmotically inducible protein